MLQVEARLAGRLSKSHKWEPQSDVWPRIQSRVSSERRPSPIFDIFRVTFSRRLAAAMATLAVLIVALIMISPWRTPSPQSEGESIKKAVALMQVQPADTDGSVVGTTDAMLQVLEDEL